MKTKRDSVSCLFWICIHRIKHTNLRQIQRHAMMRSSFFHHTLISSYTQPFVFVHIFLKKNWINGKLLFDVITLVSWKKNIELHSVLNRCRYFYFCYHNYGIRLKLENLESKGRTKLDQEKNTSHCVQWHSSNILSM